MFGFFWPYGSASDKEMPMEIGAYKTSVYSVKRFFPLFVSLLLAAGLIEAAETATPKVANAFVSLVAEKDSATLSNGLVEVGINFKSGSFSLTNPRSGEIVLSDAGMLPKGDAYKSVSVESQQDIADELGTGKRLTLAILQSAHGSPKAQPPQRLVTFTLYAQRPALVLGFGMKQPKWFRSRLTSASPLHDAKPFPGKILVSPMTLNGAAGADLALVTPGLTRVAPNSLMLTGLADGKRRTLVCGGLANKEFGKFVALRDGLLGVTAEDPVGRLIDPEQIYTSTDNFYIDAITADPFTALEQYGWAMRLANKAHPNIYDFPVLCGWGVGALSKLPNVNNSAKLVGELELAQKAGLTKYTKVGIRLEPDTYCNKDHGNTEQGWWDDEHWAKYKHLVPPYETFAKWCTAITERDGVPYTYFQLGMPSDDYARAFPGHMLFNDISQLDKKHSHHQPYVSYDYTDPDFQKRTLAMWQLLRREGMRGIKFDYPETGWRPEGGFEDIYATTNSAYRRAFELAREGLGADAVIDERNLGESGRPCLDVTAGIVDTQRTWSDSNKYDPAMISTDGLRWYKNRTVFNYYPDSKIVHGVSAGIRQSMLTMVYLTSGRIDLATSFSLFTPEITHDFTRIYPHYREPKTARPLDAFTGVRDPQVYDLELTPDWHQIALYNSGKEKAIISTSISGELVSNAIGLDPSAEYHAYEFWSDSYIGKLSGTAKLERELEPNHCAMISLRKVQPNPQVLSTNRHILQGWVDLAVVRWDAAAKTLSGTAKVIEGESFKIVITRNGFKNGKVSTEDGNARLEAHPASEDLAVIVLDRPTSGDSRWQVVFE